MKRYHGDDYTFIINRVKLEDRGEYVIRAENHYGYREEVVFLNVQRKYPSSREHSDQSIFLLSRRRYQVNKGSPGLIINRTINL